MKKLWKEFVAFISKGNALAVAIGVIIGGAFSTIVSTINEKIISPLLGSLLGEHDLSNSLVVVLDYKKDANGNILLDEAGHQVVANAIYWGAFIQSVIDFVLTAVILFAIFKFVMHISEAAKKTADMVRDVFDGDDEVKEEVVPSEPAPTPEPVVPQDILLLQEIRDLLANKDNKEE